MGAGSFLLLGCKPKGGDALPEDGAYVTAETAYGKVIRAPGIDASTVYEAMHELFPLDVLYRGRLPEPERLAEVKGISDRKAREIAEQMEEKRDLRDAMVFLQEYGISEE